MNQSTLDSGIPLLTEIISVPQIIHPPTSILSTTATSHKPAQHADGHDIQENDVQEIQGWVEVEWNRMERQIRERVLQQMLGHVDLVLEQRVRDSLADTLQITLESLTTQIREGMQQTLEEVIYRAVSQEISRLQTNQK